MFLHRIRLNPRCREARRDLADPYQLHATLSRAFSPHEAKCPPGEFLWRLEPEISSNGFPIVLVQSRSEPVWEAIGVNGWSAQIDPPINLTRKFSGDLIQNGRRFRFRLRANPCVTRNGKRLGLMRLEEQEQWIVRKGQQHGFSLSSFSGFDLSESSTHRVDVHICQERMLRGKQHEGNIIHIFSVLYDGVLALTDPHKFMQALQNGIGHGKTMGLGLLSAVPIA